MRTIKDTDKKDRKSVSAAKRPELRLRLETKEQDLLAELMLLMKAPVPEVVRQSLLNELDRQRESRSANRLDTLRSNVVALQEQVAYSGRRVEASIEIARSIEKQILGAIEEVKEISVSTGIRMRAMIETMQPDRRAAMENKIEEIVRRG